MAASLIDLLDQVGTRANRLLSVTELASTPGIPYRPNELALRCQQGKPPAIKSGREWRSSQHASRLNMDVVGRK